MGSPINIEEGLWRHRFALLTAACTFPLIFAGGLVTSTGSALAVPDWPTSYGYGMFSLPRAMMVGGAWIEHRHRQIGAIVGMLTLTLAVWIWIGEKRRSLRWLALTAIIAVCVQGLLGGLRVNLLKENLAILHACLAQAFFSLMVAIALITSRDWQKGPALAQQEADGSTLPRLTLITTGLIYLQIIFGALTRHGFAWGTPAHILVAFLVAFAALMIVARVVNHSSHQALSQPAFLLLGLVLAQVALGFLTLIWRAQRDPALPPTSWDALVPTLHVAVGALILATSVVLTLRVHHSLLAKPNKDESHFLAQPTP